MKPKRLESFSRPKVSLLPRLTPHTSSGRSRPSTIFWTKWTWTGSPWRRAGNKAETAEKYGDAQVKIWRRSYDVAPLPLAEDDPRNAKLDPRYAGVADSDIPRTESLKDAIARAVPYWKEVIFPDRANHDNIIVVAHGNSLRGIIKYLKNISDEDIISLNLPTAVPYVFEFDDEGKLVKDYFLGDQEAIAAKMNAVANQGKAQK